MRSKIISAALLAGSVAFTFSVPATSAPLMDVSGMSKAAPSSIETVQYRHWHHGHHYHGHHHHGGGAGALIGGLAAGAIIGGAIAASQANAAAQQNAAYCSRRYRSYDPASGTYLSNDGNRYPCP
jgi:Ni/Co efflux regulator RcnB